MLDILTYTSVSKCTLPAFKNQPVDQLTPRITLFGASIDVSDHRQLKTNILPGKLSIFERYDDCPLTWCEKRFIELTKVLT